MDPLGTIFKSRVLVPLEALQLDARECQENQETPLERQSCPRHSLCNWQQMTVLPAETWVLLFGISRVLYVDFQVICLVLHLSSRGSVHRSYGLRLSLHA